MSRSPHARSPHAAPASGWWETGPGMLHTCFIPHCRYSIACRAAPSSRLSMLEDLDDGEPSTSGKGSPSSTCAQTCGRACSL